MGWYRCFEKKRLILVEGFVRRLHSSVVCQRSGDSKSKAGLKHNDRAFSENHTQHSSFIKFLLADRGLNHWEQ